MLEGQINQDTGHQVILTVHHKDENPSNNERDNLICLCQGCHLDFHRKLKEEDGITPTLFFKGNKLAW